MFQFMMFNSKDVGFGFYYRGQFLIGDVKLFMVVRLYDYFV